MRITSHQCVRCPSGPASSPPFGGTRLTPIQWFPGRMRLARKQVAEAMAATEVVTEVLHARLPEASSGPMIRTLRRHCGRPCSKRLDKAGLADPAAMRAWLDHFAAQPSFSGRAAGLHQIGLGTACPRDANHSTGAANANSATGTR